MRALLTMVITMGVLIVAMVVVLVTVAVRRLAAPFPFTARVLEEPSGTHMQAISVVGDRLAVLLQGGGPDRIILLDPHSGQVAGRIGLQQ